ncbi:MAG: CDP-glucose 4,6-dehydratase [Phycisphaeraceae bacterium]
MNKAFWNNRSVFLTGHTGFKGTWMSLWLQQMGAKLTGYALAPDTTPSMFEVVQADQGMNSIINDVRDLASVQDAMQAAEPEVVIHMAAQPLVRDSYIYPVETFDTNVMGTVNVLEACRNCPTVRSVVVVTTDKCYENREWVWGYREDEPMGGHDPYSASKGCTELAAAAYRKSFFAQADGMHPALLATARAGNVIGGGDWAKDRLIPDIVRAFSDSEKVIIRSPNAVRPWQHVLEPVSAYLLLAEKLYSDGERYAEAWNIGPLNTDAQPVSWIMERMIDCWGDGAAWELDKGAQPHEAQALNLDISKAQKYLGWDPTLSLSQAIDWLVTWYRAYYGKQKDMRELTLSQIEAFMQGSAEAGTA